MTNDDPQTQESNEPSVQFILQNMTQERVSEYRSKEGRTADESERLGDLCSSEDDWVGALGHYRAAEEQGADSGSLLVKIACALDAIGEEEEAFAAFVRAYEAQPDPQTALSAADSAATSGLWDTAEEWANRAIAHDPKAPWPWYKLSQLLKTSGKPKAAAKAAGQASEANPADPDLALHWGDLALAAGDLEAAEKGLKRCLETSPSNHEAMILLGITSWRLDKPQEGLRSIRLGMELEPEPRLAPGILAVFLRDLGFEKDAEVEERKVDALSRYDKEQLARLKQRLLDTA